MKPELKVIIYEEKRILKELLDLLDMQHNYILSKDIIQMDKVSCMIDDLAKELADLELRRISIIGKTEKFSKIIESCQDDHLITSYKDIKSILHMINIQKDKNEILIKQGLFFNKKMMNLIMPSKKMATYNAYGKIER